MNATLRRLAVSSAAAAALVGSTTTIATADSAEHEATVVAVAHTDAQPGLTNGLTPDSGGVGAPLQNPQQLPAGTQQQIQTQASGGAVGVGVVAILLLGGYVVVRVKKHDMKVGDAVVVTLFGIALSGTVVGAMGETLTSSVVSSLGSVLGGL